MNEQQETIELLREIRDLTAKHVEQSRLALQKQDEAVGRHKNFTRVYYVAIILFIVLVAFILSILMPLIP